MAANIEHSVGICRAVFIRSPLAAAAGAGAAPAGPDFTLTLHDERRMQLPLVQLPDALTEQPPEGPSVSVVPSTA